MAIIRPSTKTCGACKIEKPVEEFHLSGRLEGQRRSKCILCVRADNKVRYDRNPQKKLAVSKVWREKNSSRMRDLIKRWEGANAERKKVRQKAWKKANPEAVKAASRKHYRSHTEQNKVKAARYRARKHNAPGRGITADDTQRILQLQKGKCAMCRVKFGNKFQVDHIIPLTKGGEHDPRNAQILCVSCNCSKHNKHPTDHARTLGLLL